MNAGAGHDIRLATEQAAGALRDIHQPEHAKHAPGMIEEKIDIGIVPCLAARGRVKQVKAFDAELLQFGFTALEKVDGVVARHAQ